jgi:hypothetical protein
MQTQYEVNNFSRVTFLSMLNYYPLFHILDMTPLYPSSGTEGSIQNVSSIWNVKDHGSRDVTWKPDTAKNQMYAGCSGATYVHACFLVVRARTCGHICFLSLGFAKRDFKSA